MLQLSIAAACCTILLISCVGAADEVEDARWSRQASSERERRIDDWVPVTDPCPTCKRSIIGDQRPGQSDDISSLLTPPSFEKPRNLPISNQETFFSSLPKGQNSVQFPPNRPFSLRQTSGNPNFLQQGQPNPFIQEPKQQQQFFSAPPSQSQQGFNFQQAPFFGPPQQAHFPISNQARPQFNFGQPQSINSRPQPLPPQFNSRPPPKANTFPGVVTPVQIGGLQNEKEEVQLLYVPVETLQKNKFKDSRPFGKQSSEKGPTFTLSPTSQSIIKDQRFTLPDSNQREPKQNFNTIPPQFGNPSSFQFQQIGDTNFNTGFEQNFRHPGFPSFEQQQPQVQPPPAFLRNENQNRFQFTQQQSAIPTNEIRQNTPVFNQFVSQTPAPTFTNQVQYTAVPTLPPNPPPHQPPLAVYMERNENSKVTDVLSVLKQAKTIPVLDQVEDQSPIVFVGPSSLDPPKGYVKFDLPYLSSLESNRLERKIGNLPFFVAPLNFKPPPGYSKVPFPAPHIGSVVISNSTIFKEALEKPPSNKLAYSSFDFTTQKVFSENTKVTSPSSPTFFEETKYNEISSTTPLPSNLNQYTPEPSFETNAPRFETSRPHYDFEDAQFTRKPTIETSPAFDVQNDRFTQPPPEVKPQFVDKQPEYNVNQPQDTKQEFGPGQQQFVQGNFDAKQQFNVEPQFSPEQPSVTPQFSAGTPPNEEQISQFDSRPAQFDVNQQDGIAPPQSTPQFETRKPQFGGEQITYEFERGQNNQRQPEFTNQREQDLTTQAKAPQFESQNTFEPNPPQFNNEQPGLSQDAQYNKDQIYNQQNTFSAQNNELTTIPNIQTNDGRVVSQQFQYDLTSEAPVPVESTTVHIPRRKTTTPKQYKASTPPPNYNPRRNRKPLYRGLPKNTGEIQSTTLATFNTEYTEPRRPVHTNSDITQSNQISTRFEESFTSKLENNYETVKPNKEYQTASESYYQPEIDNTVVPVFQQKTTENYPRTEKVEAPATTFTQQTPNYSNFQGINQFFNQVIQKENTYVTQESVTIPVEPQTNTVQQEISQPVFTESISQTEPTSPQSVSVHEEYTKKPNYNEKRNRYRQKLQNTVNTNENTPVYDNGQKTDSVDTEKPLRNKHKYRNRQRLANRGQQRTSTSTETVVDENIPSHFSSIRGEQDVNGYNQVTANTETQSTSTEHASTKIDVGKYGTFKRRRPAKAYERTSTIESSSVEYETTAPTVSSTRSYRPRARTTASPGERVTRNRVRRPSTSTTPEVTSVADHTEPAARAEENTSVDWGSYVSSFNPSAQGNDVLGSLEYQNKISKTEENAIDQYSIQRSQSYEITSPSSISDFSQSVVPSSDQASYSTNDQGSVSQYDRKFSAKKLNSGFVETDNTHQDTPVGSYESQQDSTNYNSGSRIEEEKNLEAFNTEDKSNYEKTSEGKKAYDPITGKKTGGRRRGQWVRVRVKKPNQEYFETAESQNVANVGNAVQSPTKPGLKRLTSEEFSKLQSENKGTIDVEGSINDNVYFTSTTEKITTTSEDGPSKFDLEKGVSAMIAEFMNVDEDESKDNAQEIFENVESKPSAESVPPTYETSVDGSRQESEPHGTADHLLESTPSTSGQSESVSVNTDIGVEGVQNRNKVYGQDNVNENSTKVKDEQQSDKSNQNVEYQSITRFNPVPSEISPVAFQTQYHENYNEEAEEKESQLKEREIKHVVNENLNYKHSNHKYAENPSHSSKSQSNEEVPVEKEVEEVGPNTTIIPEVNVEKKVQESRKEKVAFSTEIPEITTSSTDLEGLTEDYDVTTESFLPSGTTHSKVLGTSTTTEISLETEICYKGRCIKSKKKRPVYQDLLEA